MTPVGSFPSSSFSSQSKPTLSEIQKITDFISNDEILNALDRLPLIDDDEERLQARELILAAWSRMHSKDADYEKITRFLENDIVHIQPDEGHLKLFKTFHNKDEYSDSESLDLT